MWIGVVVVVVGYGCAVVVLVVATLIAVTEFGDVICCCTERTLMKLKTYKNILKAEICNIGGVKYLQKINLTVLSI